MSIWSKWFGRKSAHRQEAPEVSQEASEAGQEESEADQEKDAMGLIGSPLPGCEVAPEGQGPFGYTAANPIPVNGPVGECVYLNTLRSPSGQPVFFHRLGSVNCPTYPRMVDAYEIVSWDGSCWGRLYFDMYFKRRSCHVPEGLTRANWDQLEGPQRFLVKHCGFGLNQRVNDFPLGLPAAVREGSNGREGEIMARVTERLIEATPDSFHRPADFDGGLWVRPA
jgi:hypothetical protein